jgi:hypothetical protein
MMREYEIQQKLQEELEAERPQLLKDLKLKGNLLINNLDSGDHHRGSHWYSSVGGRRSAEEVRDTIQDL